MDINPYVHHIAIAVNNLDDALAFYRDALGLPLEERRPVPAEGVTIAFLQAGQALIELLEPLGEASNLAKFLEKRGEGLHHVCLQVPDIEAAMAQLQAQGAQLLTPTPQVDAHGTRYCFIHPRSAHGVLLELYEG